MATCLCGKGEEEGVRLEGAGRWSWGFGGWGLGGHEPWLVIDFEEVEARAEDHILGLARVNMVWRFFDSGTGVEDVLCN